MLNIAITGCTGRMGLAIAREVHAREGIRIARAVAHADSEKLGQDIGQLAGCGTLGVPVEASLGDGDFDLVVDFTLPAATPGNLDACLALGKGLVIGTTGLDSTIHARIEAVAADLPIVVAPNTSVGVNLGAALVETASRVFGEGVDIEIVEAHHRHKVDAPSGTALFLGQAAARPRNIDLERDGVYARHGQVGPRPEGSIGFATVRGGDIAGEHTVLFIGESERLEITHRVTDRRIFAAGAVRAAVWLADQPAGLYGMEDVLGLTAGP